MAILGLRTFQSKWSETTVISDFSYYIAAAACSWGVELYSINRTTLEKAMFCTWTYYIAPSVLMGCSPLLNHTTLEKTLKMALLKGIENDT